MVALVVACFVAAFFTLIVGEIRNSRPARIVGIVLLTPGMLLLAFFALFAMLYAG
jgi:hypothetical protein